MPHKFVRIVIADRHHGHRLSIEKSLNALGYFRIVPASSFEEACLLSRVNTCPVDLLIFNINLLENSQGCRIDPSKISPRIPYILPYQSNNYLAQLVSSGEGTRIWDAITGVPDFHVLSVVMGACASEVLGVTGAMG